MKKVFALFLSCAAVMGAYAQKVVLSPSVDGEENDIEIYAENMSANSQYVVGEEAASHVPAIWDTKTSDVTLITYVKDTFYLQEVYGTKSGWEYIWDYEVSYIEPVDSVWSDELVDYDNIVDYDTIPMEDPYIGSFHAVSNNGIAVGEFGSSNAEKVPAYAKMGDKEITYLYMDKNDELGSAYAVNADGSLILGFAGPGGQMTPYLWKNGGLKKEDRVALPAPTAAEFGGEIDYAAARWMSDDASVILGYAQDAVNGPFVMIYWTKNSDGSYTVHGDYAKKYYTPYEWVGTGNVDEWGYEEQVAVFLHEDRPYMHFEPIAISANGEWVSLLISPKVDVNDYEEVQTMPAARLNLKTQALEILPLPEGETDGPELFGIANDGTAVGRSKAGGMGPMPLAAKRVTDDGEEGIDDGILDDGFGDDGFGDEGEGEFEGGCVGTQGVVWRAGKNYSQNLVDILADEEFFKFEGYAYEMGLGGISADGKKVVGYVNRVDADYNAQYVSFVAEVDDWTQAINNTEEETVKLIKTIENGQLVIIKGAKRYNVMGMEF